jgi:exodeoxyribonuclease V beta subunit
VSLSFDLFHADLSGIKLIEASAGTGKTYTLAGLYLRYIVEENLLPEQILVLTFTNAATLELKTRLRQQLIDCKNYLLHQAEVEDEKLLQLYQKYSTHTDAIKTIELAIACFDQAAIFTINSFCQKIIDDYNSLCGAPVFKDLVDKKKYIEQFVYQFWRQQQKTSPIEFLNDLPPLESIVKKFSSLLSKSHYLESKPLMDWNEIDRFYEEYESIKSQWEKQKEDVISYMHNGSFGRKFTKKSHENYSNQMSDYLDTFKIQKTNLVERFTASFLNNECKEEAPLPMPAFCIEFENFYTKAENINLSYLYACWNYVKQQLNSLLSEQGKYGYDDQINIVSQAVRKHPQLVEKIADQFQCVMVDEFQDTDAQQLSIFQQCFFDEDHSVVFVGDPKQAIYEFRGADVFVYQQAKQSINQHFSLTTNWRSTQSMLAATNALFDFDNSFKMPWIEFHASETKPIHKQKVLEAKPPVAIIDTPANQRLLPISNEIKRLLSSVEIQSDNKQRLVQEQDIAILVKSNFEAQQAYEFLLSQNLNVSLWSDVGVFATDMAKQLYYLIRAIEYPNQLNINTCLHGRFFNKSINEFSDCDIELWLNEFIKYKILAHDSHLNIAIEALFKEYKVYASLLRTTDGERNYTDLMQLLELMGQQQELGHNLTQIMQWLAEEIKQGELQTEDDERKRRLESDGQKISILTMHKSKGLEFNFVFIPFAETVKANIGSRDGASLKALNAIHDDQHNGMICWQLSAENSKTYVAEKQAETIRLLYVALTRSKHRLYLGYDSQARGFDKTPIFQLLENIKDNKLLIEHMEIESPITLYKPSQQRPDLAINKFSRDIEQAQSIYSFSYLSSSQVSSNQASSYNNSYESISETIDTIDYENYFHFPKGSKSGTMQHSVFENIEFDADINTISIEVDKLLKTYSFESNWNSCLSKQVYKILNTPLNSDGIQLSQLKNTIDEMEFLLPIAKINNHQISHWLSQHRGINTPFKQDQLKGYLTGFIDLVFESNGKFYVLDYKSNHLGHSFEDYSQEQLSHAIREHNYDLQYLLYSVALIKYLKIHIPTFNYQQHFGGVLYLFTRGVNGEPQQGIYQNLPDESLMEQMLEAFSE